MATLTIFEVWATWANQRGEKFTRSARMFPTEFEALEWYNELRHSFIAAQDGGMVKYFTMHLEEKHLEPGKEA